MFQQIHIPMVRMFFVDQKYLGTRLVLLVPALSPVTPCSTPLEGGAQRHLASHLGLTDLQKCGSGRRVSIDASSGFSMHKAHRESELLRRDITPYSKYSSQTAIVLNLWGPLKFFLGSVPHCHLTRNILKVHQLIYILSVLTTLG